MTFVEIIASALSRITPSQSSSLQSPPVLERDSSSSAVALMTKRMITPPMMAMPINVAMPLVPLYAVARLPPPRLFECVVEVEGEVEVVPSNSVGADDDDDDDDEDNDDNEDDEDFNS
jgi:hypothetical protein